MTIEAVVEVMRYNDAVRRAFAELYRWQMRAVEQGRRWAETLEVDIQALNECAEGIRTSRDAITAALAEAGVTL